MGNLNAGDALRHCSLGPFILDDTHQSAEHVAAARKTDGAYRNTYDLGSLLVSHSFKPDQQDDAALFVGKQGHGAVKITQVEAVALGRISANGG